MNLDTLRQFEWHDLPLREIRLTESGAQLEVTPYNEQKKRYDVYRLTIGSPRLMRIEINGELGMEQLRNLDVTSFQFHGEMQHLTGAIGILPADAGFWTIAFEDANCLLEPIPIAGNEDLPPPISSKKV